jgi:pilus assembly protein FimV
VRQGETLYRIATNTQHAGVSLDQMLVALYRSNPQAFMDNNMNRLRAGAVLTVPTPEAVRQTSSGEARQVIQAQSADFSAYRQRLSGAVPTVRPDEPPRQARGQVQAQVDDRKQAASPTPDRLRLSQGSVQASAPEARASGDAQRRDEAALVAEMARNMEELKRLRAGASGAAGAASAPASGPALAVPGLPSTAPAPVPAPAQASAPVVAAAPSAPATVTAEPSASAAAPVVAPASAARPASTPPVAVPAPAPESPSVVSSLLDNPLLLPAAGVLVVLLAGLGYYRWRQKARSENGETSFLESRLQPDSFFGATGGQRIDTREANVNSSSMNYSLSQLDAIGDVDPVAEADVYLAYGRDLQAEEILKEAMRSDPSRLAVRSKLLEVYAKRRDTKGFELLATQLFSMTRGEGEDWLKAQALGQQIDPENPMYLPGGQPPAGMPAAGALAEPLGASTLPQSVMPAQGFATTSPSLDAQPSAFSSQDLDLDLDQPTQPGELSPLSMEATRPVGLMPGGRREDNSLEFDLPLTAPPSEYAQAPGGASPTTPMDLDFDTMSLDLDLQPAAEPRRTVPSDLEFDLGDLGVGDTASADLRDDDPLLRKLELADEFRQIGDVEGARDLLEEVVARATGPLKARAQSLLDSLGG